MHIEVIWQKSSDDGVALFETLNSQGLVSPMGAALDDGAERPAVSPKEQVLAGELGCSGSDVLMILRKMKAPPTSFRMEARAQQTDEQPRVFSRIDVTYHLAGTDPGKASRAVWLSLEKYCGVHAMLERSGAEIVARLLVDGVEVPIADSLHDTGRLRDWWQSLPEPRRLAVVTGGSRGIGRELCRQLAEQGYGVIPLARSPVKKGGESSREYPLVPFDVTNDQSIRSLVAWLQRAGLGVDLLIHNAGAIDWEGGSAAALHRRELRRIFDVNLFAVAELNRAMLPLLRKGASVLVVSSHMGLPDRRDFDAMSYRLSKSALIHWSLAFGAEMSAQKKDIAVACFHPGSVATAMNPQGRLSPEASARQMLLALSQRGNLLERNGAFWKVSEDGDSPVPWAISSAPEE